MIPVVNTDAVSPETDTVPTSIEEVSCPFITAQLHKSLEQLSSFSDKQAVLELYHMLSVLDQYLYDNPSQHTYCMSPNNEFVVLVKHTLQIYTDITEFPKIWAILSILLDTQDSTLQYVQYFQHAYNEYYKAKSHKQVRKIEAKLPI